MEALELRGISKSFGRNQVLFDVNFSVKPGEIHGIMGENGAGKSTMMNIVYGILPKDEGEILVNGETVEINSVQDAQTKGICFVQQEIALCQDLSVAENIFMSEINHGRGFNMSKLAAKAKELLKPLGGGNINPYSTVDSLPISSQQVVEIAKALSGDCKILILDEPTSSLSGAEADALHELLHKLKDQGIGIIYISHRMGDVFAQCDRVSVLRDGRMISTKDIKDVKIDQLVRDMAGRDVSVIYPEKKNVVEDNEDEVILSVKGLTDANKPCRFEDINFELHKGEILGFAGLLGAGRSETMLGVVGLRKVSSGEVIFKGKNIVGKSTSKIFNDGLVMLPEDRKTQGLFLDYDIEHNVCSDYLNEVTRKGWISKKKEIRLAKKMSEEMGVKSTGISQIVRSLSGGNQQKVLLSKTLAKKPDVVIMDEPTRGVDVAAKADIHKLLRKLADEGVGVIMISSELEEVMGMSDRVCMMDATGHLIGVATGDNINSDYIMYHISGAYKYESEKKEDKES